MDDAQSLPTAATSRALGETGLTLIDDFCSEAEAAALIERARPLLEPSTVALGEELVVAANRSSQSALVLAASEEPGDCEALLERLAAVAGLPSAHLEGLWVVHYGPGEGYLAHRDYYRPADHAALMEDWGNRVVTVLVYLNDVEDGGETEFPELGLRVQPRLGRAVTWLNVDADGTLHPETLHASLPLGSGEKWALNAWFREVPTGARTAPPPRRRSAPPGRRWPAGATGLPRGVAALP